MAQWAQIGVTMIAQVVLVPIYLAHWSVEKYGIWLAIQGIMSVVTMLDMGYHTYLSFEFLKLAGNDKLLLSKSLWSALVIAVVSSLVQLLLITSIVYFGAMPFLFGAEDIADSSTLTQAGVALMLQGLCWLLVWSLPGLMVKALAGYGYFARTAWWSFTYAIIAAVSPIIAVVLGGDLLHAALALTVCALIYAFALYLDLFKLLKREGIRLVKPSFPLGWTYYRLSLPLLGKSVLENLRQQGVRLVLAPLAGAAGLAAFSTMRTGANAALQGLNTVIHPLVPDLMRFLHNRDQERSEAAFSTIWVVVVFLVAPGIVVLQVVIEPFFPIWTHGKIAFNPMLFATLSLGVLVYAVIQPAMAVVMGNNLTKVQLAIAIVAAAMALGLMFALVPLIGILGAGIALLVAEIGAAAAYLHYAQKWLVRSGLKWPSRAFQIAMQSLAICSASLLGMVIFPSYKWPVFACSILAFIWNGWKYWQVLPEVAITSARNVISKVPAIENLFFRGRMAEKK